MKTEDTKAERLKTREQKKVFKCERVKMREQKSLERRRSKNERSVRLAAGFSKLKFFCSFYFHYVRFLVCIVRWDFSRGKKIVVSTRNSKFIRVALF